jgi:predicted nuclease of predicted toxin-antitoxin system
MNSSELKFLVDVGVSKKVEEYLKTQGYDTKNVRDVDTRMTDENIIRLAASEQRMVITMDKDFGELVYHSDIEHCGVLLLRMENATGSEKLDVVSYILSNYSDKIKDSFCVYQNNRFRIRKRKTVKRVG